MSGSRHVVGKVIEAGALVGVAQLVTNDGGPEAGATGFQGKVLGEHLGLELPALRELFQLATHRVEVVDGEGRVDGLCVFLHNPDDAPWLAQQVNRLSRLVDPIGVAQDLCGHV